MIIPSINCRNFNEAAAQIKTAEEFAPWVHIDISDGKFTPYLSWGNPEEFRELETQVQTEVHLMMENPEKIVEEWLQAGVKRIIVHLESVKDLNLITQLCQKYEAEVMLAIAPQTEVQKLKPHLNSFQYFQILAVLPGPSGQEFKKEDLEKIRFLREGAPNAKIEVDGGINPETARLAKAAGADILVSSHYIFSAADPQAAYRELESI